jgi:FlaA1/EpsC-like NDP-sugar epimerase
MLDAMVALPRIWKRTIVILVDVALCTLAVWLGYYLRLGEFVSLDGEPTFAVLISVAIAIPTFVVWGLYRAVLRYGGTQTAWAVVRACTAYGVIYATIFTAYGIDGVPRTVGIIQPLLLFAMIFLSRASASYWLGGAYSRLVRPAPSKRTLIYGAGASGQQLAAAIADSRSMKVVGFLDDDRTLRGRTIAGLRVYSPQALPDLLPRFDVHHVLLAMPSASRGRRNAIISQLRDFPVEVRTLPGVLDLAYGQIKVDDLRPLSIEDLLSRDPVAPDVSLLLSQIAGKTVLITGAGGSIGSELARQVLALNPARLLLLETSEFALYSIHRELTAARTNCEVIPLLGSVTDAGRVREVIATWRPEQIYHAAAFKHVPLVEHNVVEGVRNNVLGTLTVAKLAAEFGVDNMVLVSTDKAVRPTNTMGASKRLAELVLQGLATSGSRTCFSMVRFGNVLGSSGSVVPLFREQIQQGGPVTVTDVEMTRYFMTIPEAAQLVLQAGAMARGGEVFVLDMGSPVKIVDLARNMIELSGMTVRDAHNPAGDIEIKSVGLRPGEKLYEELLIGDDPQPTTHARIMMATEKSIPWLLLQPEIEQVRAQLEAHDVDGIRRSLLRLVEEFAPTDGLMDWTHLATATLANADR